MKMAPKPLVVPDRASLSDAKLAYFCGDFERCLEICTNIRVRTVATASEVALLSARAYLRMGRPGEAQATLAETLVTHVTHDASLTAQMLLATAQIRQGDPDAGIAMLAQAENRSAGAHFAIRSEIAFSTALGYWAKREIETAETFLARVDSRSDIIHARALELQAWCHTARRDYLRSAQYFRFALVRLDDCQASDRAISATAISSLAIFAAELFNAELARFVEVRAQQMDWSSGLSTHHYVTLAHQALYYEFAGDTVKAYQFASLARESAPTIPFEVFSWGLSSAIARNAGEAFSAIVFAQRARDLLNTLDFTELAGEERFSMLSVAENCAHFDASTATELFARYWGLVPVDAMLASAGDPRLGADETQIAGVIARAAGDARRAEICYRQAFETFRSLGYIRRALTSAFALFKLTGDSEARAYLDTQLVGTVNFITNALTLPDDDRIATLQRHPIIAALPNTQREVVMLICLGKTNKEVAHLRAVGEQTIKNMLTKSVFPAFGVSNRAALISTCLRERAPSA